MISNYYIGTFGRAASAQGITYVIDETKIFYDSVAGLQYLVQLIQSCAHEWKLSIRVINFEVTEF